MSTKDREIRRLSEINFKNLRFKFEHFFPVLHEEDCKTSYCTTAGWFVASQGNLVPDVKLMLCHLA